MEIQFEIGHKALKNLKPTTEGDTHDWTVYVQGIKGNEIKHIVEKVIFHLPDSFPDQKQTREKPPFILSESTSKSFTLNIDVYFCAGSKLDKVSYPYHLFISPEDINHSWERKLIFPNPSQDFKEKLLLAGGKMVDFQKTSEVKEAFIKVEPSEEIEIISDAVITEKVNSTVQHNENLHELLKENESLKTSNRELLEKTKHQDNLINSNEKRLSNCEKSVQTTLMRVADLKKKIETSEKDIASLKLQVQTLQNEFSLFKNQQPRILEEKKKGLKRKCKLNEHLILSAPAQGKKRNYIQPAKFILTSSIHDSNTSQSSSPLVVFSVPTKNSKNCKSVSSKRTASTVQNFSFSKTDTLHNDSRDVLSGNHLYSQSNLVEIQPRNDKFSLQQNKYGKVNFETVSHRRNVSLIKSKTESHDKEKPVEEMVVELMEIDSSPITPELVNHDIEKPIEGSSEMFSLNPSKIVSIDIEKHIEGTSIEANCALNKSEIKLSDSDKLAYESSMEVNSSQFIPGTNINDIEKSVERNSAVFNISPFKPKINKNYIKEPIKIKDSEKLLKGISYVTDASLNKPETRNVDDEKMVERNSPEFTTTLNTFEINNVKPIEGNSTETLVSNKPHIIDLVEEPVNHSVKEQHISSDQETNIESHNSSCKESDQKHSNFSDIKVSSLTLSNRDHVLQNKNESKEGYVQKPRSDFESENLNVNSICMESHQDINRISVPYLMEFVTDHCQKLTVELNRIKCSKFCKFKHKTNPLHYKLGNINSSISEKYFMRYIRSITEFFVDPKMSFDMATIVYLIVDYLSCSTIKHRNLPTYIQNQDVYVCLPRSENCIISALYEVEKMSIPILNGLIRNTLDIIHRVIISKKRMAVCGLASLCRVFMTLCKHNNDRFKPLFLCCKSLKLRLPLAPYLINVLASVWKDPFYLHHEFSVEERLLLDSIIYGMKVKPLLMDSNLWMLTCRFTSTNFSFPIIVDPHKAIHTLTSEILLRCADGLFENLWMLIFPLLIFVSNETWDWIICFRNEYILPNLHYFSKCLNEQAFNLFCNLYVDVCNFCHENPVGELMQHFINTELYEGVTSMQDCVAVALLEHIITTDGHIPIALGDWFLKNKNNQKLRVLVDLYCKRVMESQDNLFSWADVIIL